MRALGTAGVATGEGLHLFILVVPTLLFDPEEDRSFLGEKRGLRQDANGGVDESRGTRDVSRHTLTSMAAALVLR